MTAINCISTSSTKPILFMAWLLKGCGWHEI
jgi:hypothetical protein|eukprot:CAMPEP_0169122066 /NCGR_PEP_ID=MMETSP1015-20121227/33013_1 /TAXON_ID=342587 /ORGANISM="Karlodinium micrum, Strain CCMP2283" /LENGTH=30 /DNA_ID= /DNA_START= /DNA_END= /DNA_ORIENTATION=